jgi:peptide/nickel transport system substrate-binding protein
VREAVEYAIDKVKICQSVGLGYWTPLYQAAFPYHAEYIDDLEGRVYNPAKAKQLLAEAGYPDGFKTIFYAGVHLGGDHVVAMQANFQAVGIDADIDPISVGKWIELETNGWDEGLMLTPQGGQSPYATYMMRFWFKPSEPNWSQGLYWTALDRPNEMQAIVQQYIDAHGVDEQTAAGRKLIQYMYDHETVIPLWQQADIVITDPSVKDGKWGDDANPSPWNFTGIWMSED